MADNPFLQFGTPGGRLRAPNANPPAQPRRNDPLTNRITARAKAEGYPEEKDIVKSRGAPANVRAAVASVQKNSDQLAALKKYYPQVLPYGTDNFIFRDPKNGNKWTTFNPPGLDRGDVAANGRLAANIVGGFVGGVAGAPAGPAGVVGGGAVGATAGGVLYDKGVQMLTGAQDTRTAGQQATDAAIETGLNVVVPAVGGKLVKIGRNFFRAGSKEAVEAAARQGIRAPAAVTGSKGVQMTSGALDATATSSGRMATRAEQFTGDLGGRLRQVTRGTVGDRTEAGNIIVTAANRKVGEFRTESRKLYDAVDALVPPNTPVAMSNFSQAVDDIVGRFTNNPEWEDVLTDPLIKRIRDATDISATKGGISYQVMKDIRTLLGQEIGRGEGQLIGKLGSQDTNALFAALTKDLEAAAQTVGGDAGLQAAQAANTYWREGRNLIDNFVNPLVKQGTRNRAPEAVYESFVTRAAETPSILDQWSQVLNVTERDSLGKFTASRLGSATAATEDAVVNAASDITFNPNAFARNFNNTFNGADRQVTRDFFFPDKQVLSDVNDLFTLSAGARSAGLQNNSSRTAAVTGLTSAGGAAATTVPLILSGGATAADVAVTGGMGALAWPVLANPLARAMTSQTGERILSRPPLESAFPKVKAAVSEPTYANMKSFIGELLQSPYRQEENAVTGFEDDNPFFMFGDQQQ